MATSELNVGQDSTGAGTMPKKIGDITLYSVEELSEALDVGDDTIRRMLREGQLKGRKIARRWYTTEEHLREYLQATEPAQDQGSHALP